MKVETALSDDGKQLFLVINYEEPIAVEMNVESAVGLMNLLYELIKEAKARQTIPKKEGPLA